MFVKTIASVMGTYYKPASIETFIAHAQPQHPCDIADLWDARMVSAVETCEGQYWDESRLKMLTGRERQKARFMRSNPTDRPATRKYWIMGNQEPKLGIIDPAIMGRLYIVPFLASFPPGSPLRIENLEDQLIAEWPQILRWQIDACVEWQQERLKPPRSVTEASRDYFEGEDTMGRWLDECAEVGPQILQPEEYRTIFTPTERLYGSFKRWSDHVGEKLVWTERKFSDELAKREHLRRDRRREGYKQQRGFYGIRLLGQISDEK